MNKFLRLFSSFRQMEDELAAAASARIQAEDEVRTMRVRVESAESERDKSRAELNNALKSIANFEAIRHGSARVPFPEAFVAMPEPEVSDPNAGPPAPRTMREMEQAARAKSRAAAAERRRGMFAALDAATEN